MSNPVATTPASSTIAEAAALLEGVADRAKHLRQELLDRPPDQAAATALYGVAGAAAATLSAENLRSLTVAVRAGKLPRLRMAR